MVPLPAWTCRMRSKGHATLGEDVVVVWEVSWGVGDAGTWPGSASPGAAEDPHSPTHTRTLPLAARSPSLPPCPHCSLLPVHHRIAPSTFALTEYFLNFPIASLYLSLTLLSSATIQTLLSAPYLLPLSLPAHVRYPLPFNQIPFPASLDIGSSSFSSNTAILKLFFPRFTTN